MPHTASGEGLHEATVGVPASFMIQLVAEDGKNMSTDGIVHDNWRLKSFVYVWISNEDQVRRRTSTFGDTAKNKQTRKRVTE